MSLILHAGAHKTGTSTIQRVLHDHRSALRRQGLYYPDPRPWFGPNTRAHQEFAHAIARRDETLPTARSFVDELRRAAMSNETILLSAEPVYRHVRHDADGGWWARHGAYLRSLARELHGLDASALLVFRRRDTYIESVYHERVSKGYGRPFTNMVRRSQRLLDYDRHVRVMSRAFGPLDVASYEQLKSPDLVSGFLGYLGFRAPPSEGQTWERTSTDARLTLWMAKQYRADRDPEMVDLRRRFSQQPLARELFEDFGRVTLWRDPVERRELLRSYGDHEPIHDPRAPAALSAPDEDRIAAAFDTYLASRGRRTTEPAHGSAAP